MSRSRQSAKTADTRFERAIADYLAERLADDRIDRRAKTGNKDRGDIGGVRTPHGGRVVVECKDVSRLAIGEWVAEAETERGNDDALVGIVVHKRRGVGDPGAQYVTMTVDDLVALLCGHREGMAEALGWGFDSEPSCTVSSGGAATGGAEPFANAGYRKRLASFVSAGVTGEGRPKDVQTQPADTIAGKGTAYFLDRPAPTIVGTRRSKDGMIVGRQLPPGEGENVGGWGWADRPAPTPAWVEKRPSTTVAADPRIADPGYRKGKERQFRPDGIRVTVQEAGILQSFPADYPWQGTRTKQYEQVGNAVPPLLAAHVLAALGVGTLEAAA